MFICAIAAREDARGPGARATKKAACAAFFMF